jgi:rhodanese-related sulfurtransferase
MDALDTSLTPSAGFRTNLTGLLLLCSLFCVAVEADTAVKAPEDIPGSTKVDAEGLIDLLDRIPDELLVIDARIESDRKHGYIEGSISLPDIDTTCASLASVIPTTGTPVLFYCNGPKCGRSVISVRVALGCGYTNIYWFRGGFEEWMAKGYPILKP